MAEVPRLQAASALVAALSDADGPDSADRPRPPRPVERHVHHCGVGAGAARLGAGALVGAIGA